MPIPRTKTIKTAINNHSITVPPIRQFCNTPLCLPKQCRRLPTECQQHRLQEGRLVLYCSSGPSKQREKYRWRPISRTLLSATLFLLLICQFWTSVYLICFSHSYNYLPNYIKAQEAILKIVFFTMLSSGQTIFTHRNSTKITTLFEITSLVFSIFHVNAINNDFRPYDSS